MTANIMLAFTLAAACLTTPPAIARQAGPASDSADEAAVPTVVLRGARDPAITPYVNVYNTMTKTNKISDKIELVMRIVAAESKQPMPDLEVFLQGETVYEKLAVTPDGVVTVPLGEKYLADKTVFLTNKKKGTMRAEQYLLPKLPRQHLTFADIDESIDAARRARAEALPWYVRVLVGNFDEIHLCYPDNRQSIGMGTGASRPATSERKHLFSKKTIYCAAFSAKEAQAAKATALTLPDGWIAQFH